MTGQRELVGQVVLSDMDGTLVDSTAIVEAVWGEFATWYRLPLAEILASSHGRLTVDTVREFGPPGIDVNAITNKLEALELARLEGIVEIPGARDFMAALLAVDAVALVTSAPRELATLRMAGVGIAMPVVSICAGDVARGKPDPEGYRKAAERMNCDPASAIVFEDAEAGVIAGLTAGCQVVVVGPLDTPITRDLPRIPDMRSVTLLDQSGRIGGNGITLLVND